MTKACKACGAAKPIHEFPTYSAGGSTGIRGTCRTCWNKKWTPVIVEHGKRYYHENHAGARDKAKVRAAVHYQRLTTEEKRTRFRLHEARHPDHAAAKQAVMVAVRSGRLKRKPCEVCSAAKVQAHHDDYSRPLDVIWLCRSHHGERHRLLNRVTPASEWPSHWPAPIRGRISDATWARKEFPAEVAR